MENYLDMKSVWRQKKKKGNESMLSLDVRGRDVESERQCRRVWRGDLGTLLTVIISFVSSFEVFVFVFFF